MLNVDLHTHSDCSDGALSPESLVRDAARAGVECLALTDHDTVAGLARARKAAQAHGIDFINGIELSVSWRGRTLHIVGLAINPDTPALSTLIDELQKARDERATRLAGKLEKLGVADCLARARALSAPAPPGRPHFARLLVEDGLCSSLSDAFKRHLRPGRAAHVKAQWAELQQTIEAIAAAQGVAVLAHPLSYGMTAAWQDRMLTAFKAAGGQAMEVVYGAYNPQQIRRCAELATRYRLMGSVGSDFHSPAQRWLRLGRPLRLPPQLSPVWQRLHGGPPAGLEGVA